MRFLTWLLLAILLTLSAALMGCGAMSVRPDAPKPPDLRTQIQYRLDDAWGLLATGYHSAVQYKRSGVLTPSEFADQVYALDRAKGYLERAQDVMDTGGPLLEIEDRLKLADEIFKLLEDEITRKLIDLKGKQSWLTPLPESPNYCCWAPSSTVPMLI